MRALQKSIHWLKHAPQDAKVFKMLFPQGIPVQKNNSYRTHLR